MVYVPFPNLTLTSVVFEYHSGEQLILIHKNLTLTSVVFEWRNIKYNTMVIFNLTLTSVVFESEAIPKVQSTNHI